MTGRINRLMLQHARLHHQNSTDREQGSEQTTEDKSYKKISQGGSKRKHGHGDEIIILDVRTKKSTMRSIYREQYLVSHENIYRSPAELPDSLNAEIFCILPFRKQKAQAAGKN